MRWNPGSAMWRRLANRPFGELPLYSKSPPSLTEKLIWDGWVATPRRSISRTKPG